MLDKLKELMEADPFVPFEIGLTSGDRFRIENPGLLALSENQLAYYLPRSDGVLYLRLNQVVWIMAAGRGREM